MQLSKCCLSAAFSFSRGQLFLFFTLFYANSRHSRFGRPSNTAAKPLTPSEFEWNVNI